MTSPSAADADATRLIVHLDDLPTYSPPAHAGTVNRRLVDPAFTDDFDMVHGTIEPGGKALRHLHDREFQVIFILEGQATVTLGDAPAQVCKAGHVVCIPPGLAHEVVSQGPAPLRLVVIYSPRLVGPPIPA